MVLIQFASSPTDPTWEPPRWQDLHVRKIRFGRTSDDCNPAPRSGTDTILLSERAQALDDAASELNRLCASNAPLSDVQDFLAPWMLAATTATEDSSGSSPRPPPGGDKKVQPNLLAWLDDANALRWACDGNDEALVRFLLCAGLALNEAAVVHAVAKARETRDPRVLGLLLDAGWDVNKPLGENAAPLLSALIHHQDLVLWCLSRGADPNAPSSAAASRTIMEQAAAAASPATLRQLVDEHGADVARGSLVAHASRAHAEGSTTDRLEAARFLLDRGAPVNAYYLQNRSGGGGGSDRPERQRQGEGSCCGITEAVLVGQQNALHFAVWSGKTDMARLLIERGADRTAPACSLIKTDNATMSPLELALKYGHHEVADLLRAD